MNFHLVQHAQLEGKRALGVGRSSHEVAGQQHQVDELLQPLGAQHLLACLGNCDDAGLQFAKRVGPGQHQVNGFQPDWQGVDFGEGGYKL